MPSPLYLNEDVRFVAGKNFLFAGHQYTVGDDFDQELSPGRTEQLVRTRHIYPVVDNAVDKPRFFHREIHDPANLERILGKDRGKGQIVIESSNPVEEPDARGPEDVSEHLHQEAQLNALTEEVLEQENAEEPTEPEETEPEPLVHPAEPAEHDDVEEPDVLEEDLYDPSAHNAPDVIAYLNSEITQEEYDRVLLAERLGKARKGILGE